jgi:Pyruvate/2-oxoacid:ferredoxin oxidoreductase gamma subunit
MTHMSSTKQNGAETRYYVRIGDREHYLFLEDAQLSRAPRWFVEGKAPM